MGEKAVTQKCDGISLQLKKGEGSVCQKYSAHILYDDNTESDEWVRNCNALIELCNRPDNINFIDYIEKDILLDQLERFEGYEDICSKEFNSKFIKNTSDALKFLNDCLSKLRVVPQGDDNIYKIENLEGVESLDVKNREKVQLRIDDFNGGLMDILG